jgi:hypothetical protein
MATTVGPIISKCCLIVILIKTKQADLTAWRTDKNRNGIQESCFGIEIMLLFWNPSLVGPDQSAQVGFG